MAFFLQKQNKDTDLYGWLYELEQYAYMKPFSDSAQGTHAVVVAMQHRLDALFLNHEFNR